MQKYKAKKEVVEQITHNIEKSNSNRDALGRFTFGKKLLAPDTGANGGSSVSISKRTHTEKVMNVDITDNKGNVSTKSLKVKDFVEEKINKKQIGYKYPSLKSKTEKRNFAVKHTCKLIDKTEIKIPDEKITKSNCDSIYRAKLQEVVNIFKDPKRGICPAIDNKKVIVKYEVSGKHVTNKLSTDEKIERAEAVRFIPEIIEKEGHLLGSELVENRGYADVHYELIGKCKFSDGTIHRVSVVVADRGDDLLHLTIYGKDIQKSFRHDTSDGIIGASSSIVKNLEANSTSFSVFGIDILSKSITSSKVDKSTKGFSSQKLMLTKCSLSQQSNLSSKNVIKSLTYSGHKLQGRTKLYGMDISIENKKGSYRSGVDSDGHKWKCFMNYDYGYIRGTEGVDGDHVDCYIGPDKEAQKVYIIHQNNPVTHKYDEDKCMLCFESADAAKKAYMKQYDRPGFFGSMETLTIEQFKSFVFSKQGKRIHKSFDVIVSDITENNKSEKVAQVQKSLFSLYKNKPFVIKHIPADDSKHFDNITLRITDFDRNKIEKAVHKMAMTLDADLKSSAIGEAFNFKSQEELTDTFVKELTQKTNSVYQFVIDYFDLPEIRVVSKANLKYKGKIIYNPETGKPIQKSEWNKFVEGLEKFLNRNYNGIGERIVLSAETLGILLERLSKNQDLKTLKNMPLSELSYKGKKLEWISQTASNMKDVFGETVSRERAGRIQVAIDSAAVKVTRVTDNMRNDIQNIIIDGIKNKESRSQISQNLFDKCVGLNRDFQKIADTEIQNNVNNAYLKEEVYQSKEGEKVYFKRYEILDDNTCKKCLKIRGEIALWSDVALPDEHITDEYAKYAIWEGKEKGEMPVSIMHPYCRGSWFRYYPDKK